MKRQGQIVRWEAERGFGFIRSPQVTADVFVHLRDFQDRGVTPRVGMAVHFDEIHVGGKGPRAVAVQLSSASASPAAPVQAQRRPLPRARPQSAAPMPSAAPAVLLILGYAALLAWAVLQGRLPSAALAAVAGLSALTFGIYGADKQAARSRQWRTAENTLHLLALAGGWPGAWVAQRVFRHKSSKTSFMAAYWATVWLHLAAVLAWVFWFAGQPAWR